MDAYTFKNPGFYDAESNDTLTIRQLVTLCAELQSDIAALRAQVAELVAMRDTLNAVFTIEAPAAVCPECMGSGLVRGWETLDDRPEFFDCECVVCDGTGKVQP